MINLESIVAAVKEDGNIQGTTRDDTIERKAAAVWKEMESYCGQPLVAETGNVVWRPSSASLLYHVTVPYFPVQAIESLTYRTWPGGEEIEVDADQYAVSGNLLYYGGMYLPGFRYTFTLTVGADDIPADVLDVAVELTIHSLARTRIPSIGENKIGMQQRSESNPALGTATQVYRDERAAILDRLKGYRVPII